MWVMMALVVGMEERAVMLGIALAIMVTKIPAKFPPKLRAYVCMHTHM